MMQGMKLRKMIPGLRSRQQKPDFSGKLLTIRQAAEWLGISYAALRNRIYRGQVPYRKWGGRVYLTKEDLEDFLAGIRVKPKR